MPERFLVSDPQSCELNKMKSDGQERMRDHRKGADYFDRCITFRQEVCVEQRLARLGRVDDPAARVRALAGVRQDAIKVCILRYGRGDALDDIRTSTARALRIDALLRDAIESLGSEAKQVAVRNMVRRVNLGDLYDSLSLSAFLVALQFPKSDVAQLLGNVARPGEVPLVDRLRQQLGDTITVESQIAKVGRVYAPLVGALDMNPPQRSELLRDYLEQWYSLMQPVYWHDNEWAAEGAYFGYWCFEGALAAMLFQVDDPRLRECQYFPADLVFR